MWSIVSRRLAAPPKLWLMSSTPSAPQLLDQATGKRIATVEELRALCEQARCERYYKADLSVRKTLRALPGKVGVEWAGLQAALAQLEREGFLRGPVTAKLHDVLLYSPGDFFKPHVDTKKCPKHLMTLAVDTGLCPPSYDGELVLGDYNDLKEEWLPSSAGSFCAWSTNVVNEVMPLLSGNRCVAVYNVSAEGFNQEGLEKRKLDSIVDALRLLVKEKANDCSWYSTKTHIGFALEMVDFVFSREKAIPPSSLGCDSATLLKAVERGFGVTKEDLQILRSVSLIGEGFRGVHGDYIEEVPTSNTKEEQTEQDKYNKQSGGSMYCDFAKGVADHKKHAALKVVKEACLVTVLAVDPEAKSPFQQYVVPAERYNSTWMWNAHQKLKPTFGYFGYNASTDNGTDLYLSCRIYLRVPRKYFPELNVTLKRGRSVEL
jgi:hypothetical protein